MKAKTLYKNLEKDFIKLGITDDWAAYMSDKLKKFVAPQYLESSTGLVCDFTEEINQVFTAVFPSDQVLTEIINMNVINAMLFLHHPAVWNITKQPPFVEINLELLAKLQERKISIYNLHLPLDNFSEYSTSKTLSDQLDLEIVDTFAIESGATCGIVGKTKLSTVYELQDKLAEVITHKSTLYLYGKENISKNKVAVVAGGGNTVEVLKDVFKRGINTFITGITANNDYSKISHQYAWDHGINILGGTHYSTEKFACIKMCDYFKKLGLIAQFTEDKPLLEDL